jgi:hypothetical protein
MIITFYFALSWIMMGLLIFNQKESRGTRRDISFLVLFSCLINTHTYLGLFETFKWMKTTTNPKLYIAFLLFRSVLIPLIASYFTLHITNSSLKKQMLLVFLYCLIITGLDTINVNVHLYSFKIWNHSYTVGYYLIYLFTVMFALSWFRGIDEQEVKKADEVRRR